MSDILDQTPEGDTQEYRIFGPPGCGKTSTLTRQIKLAVEKFTAEKVVACSFTRAAAAELVSRDLALPKNNLGTIHSLCYRAQGNPNLAEQKIVEYNATVPSYMQLSSQAMMAEDADVTVDSELLGMGDRTYAQIQVFRNRGVPQKMWPMACRALYAKWCDFKKANSLVDFTDLLERALTDMRLLPGDPRVLVVDEGQDLTPLQLAVVRQWARHVDFLLLCADDDQCIYSFIGCTPEAVLTPDVPASHKRYLTQSYRVPRRVQSYAMRHIEQVQTREPKTYLPRDVEGAVRHCQGTYAEPKDILDDVERTLVAGRRAMVLAPCAYQLQPFRAGLIERGIPFHNPYRRSRSDWNPFNPSRGVATLDRVLAYLRPRRDVWGEGACAWTGAMLKSWTDLIVADSALVRGGKKAIDELPSELPVTYTALINLFRPEALDELIAGLQAESLNPAMEWIEKRLLKAKASAASFPLAVLRKRGAPAVSAEPQVVIGTIHSVKGGQSDVVYLIPDISRQAFERTAQRQGADEVRRVMYVGMTRARESLVLCTAAARMKADLNWNLND